MQSACSHSVVSDPATVARQAPPSMGFPRQECWSGLPCPPPGDLPDPGIKPESSALQADSLPSEPRYTGSAQLTCLGWMNEVLSQLQGTSIPLVCPILCPLYLVTASPSLRELHPSTPIPLSFPSSSCYADGHVTRLVQSEPFPGFFSGGLEGTLSSSLMRSEGGWPSTSFCH